jgi:hypothetical protein
MKERLQEKGGEKNMNKLHSKFASVVILAILLFSLNSLRAAAKAPSNSIVPRGNVENYAIFDIYTERYNANVGTVEIWSDQRFTYARYSTIPGWFFIQTNLHLAMILREIPQTETGEPLPARFAYKVNHNLVNVYTFQIPRTEWRYGAAYSIVKHGSNNPTEEIGWAHKREITRSNYPPNPRMEWYFENRN